MGLNISKICEDALKVYIEAIKSSRSRIYQQKQQWRYWNCRLPPSGGAAEI